MPIPQIHGEVKLNDPNMFWRKSDLGDFIIDHAIMPFGVESQCGYIRNAFSCEIAMGLIRDLHPLCNQRQVPECISDREGRVDPIPEKRECATPII